MNTKINKTQPLPSGSSQCGQEDRHRSTQSHSVGEVYAKYQGNAEGTHYCGFRDSSAEEKT